MPIITTTEYKAAMGITDSGWDTRIGIFITIAQSTLEDHCGRSFDETTYTDAKFSGNGERSLWINNHPVTAVSSVKTVDSTGTATTLDSTAYRFTSEGELFRLDGSYESAWDKPVVVYPGARSVGPVWSDSEPDNILISYTGGYSTHPASLKALMYVLVDGLLDEAGENWKLASSADGVINRSVLAPEMITRRYADLCRPWRGSGLAVL